MTNETHANPFRNALQTFNMLPDEHKAKFFDSFMIDVSDLQHNANPIEHEPASDDREAVAYVETFDGVADEMSRWNVVDYLTKLADAFDLIKDRFEEDETTFAGEHVASGLYLDFPSHAFLDRVFFLTVNPDEDDEITFTFANETPVRIISEGR